MALGISGSVGQGGINGGSDVEVVQSLLNLKAASNLAVDRLCGPRTIGAIRAFQSSFLPYPDGRIDVGGRTWGRLLEAPPASNQQSAAIQKRNEYILKAVDDDPTLREAGVIYIDTTGRQTELRGGPRRQFIYISEAPISSVPQPADKNLPTFWDRWNAPVLSCGSAVGTGVVIYLSGGTASVVVGAFAVNSAALCGMSLGKAIEYDAWQEFERNGGLPYKAWLTVETAMSLADLFNGVKGAMGFLKAWKDAGKLARLQAAVGGKKLTRKQLLKIIQELDPSFNANLASRGQGYYSKAKLVLAGQQVLAANGFRTLSLYQTRTLVDAVGNAITLYGTGDAIDAAEKTYDVWLVQYDDKAQ
jgi:peptidoglycan hydrolase-like protein with peptidoglycan-binding domain